MNDAKHLEFSALFDAALSSLDAGMKARDWHAMSRAMSDLSDAVEAYGEEDGRMKPSTSIDTRTHRNMVVALLAGGPVPVDKLMDGFVEMGYPRWSSDEFSSLVVSMHDDHEILLGPRGAALPWHASLLQ